jgi:hypothetical protein
MCDQMINCQATGTNVTCAISGEGGCNDETAIHCPQVNVNGIIAVTNATILKKYYYIDPTSFVNNTYLTYMVFGNFEYPTWSAIVCNRTTEALYQSHWAKVYWGMSFVSVIIGSVVFLLIMSQIFRGCQTNFDTINPENYRLVRRGSTLPFRPITQPAPSIDAEAPPPAYGTTPGFDGSIN